MFSVKGQVLQNEAEMHEMFEARLDVHLQSWSSSREAERKEEPFISQQHHRHIPSHFYDRGTRRDDGDDSIGDNDGDDYSNDEDDTYFTTRPFESKHRKPRMYVADTHYFQCRARSARLIRQKKNSIRYGEHYRACRSSLLAGSACIRP